MNDSTEIDFFKCVGNILENQKIDELGTDRKRETENFGSIKNSPKTYSNNSDL